MLRLPFGNTMGVKWVSAQRNVAHYIQSLHLASVLDELRDVYDICKELGHPELLSLVMRIRRQLLDALHESLNLYGENAELHQQLSEAQAQIKQLRSLGAHATLTAEVASPPATRKLS